MTFRTSACLWLGASLRSWHAFGEALEAPDETQEALVLDLVRRNEGTAFGRAHRFGTIRSLAAYRSRVPLATPEGLAPWTERVARGEAGVLTADPVPLLVPTSGSTAAPKLIPFTATFRREVDRAVGPWVADLFLGDPRLLLGRHYWSLSPVLARGGREGPAVPVGFPDETEYLGGVAARLAAALQAVPATLRDVPVLDAFRHLTLLHLLAARDLALVSVWSPAFLTLLLEALPAMAASLVRDLHDGTPRPPGGLAGPLSRALAGRLVRAPARAAEVERVVASVRDAPERHARLWPHLRLVSSWADGASAREARRLGRLLPQARLQPKGLAATEGVASIPFGRGAGGLLAIRSHGVELLPDGRDESVLPSAAVPGEAYEVVLTTGAGLYRYRTADLVEVTGRQGRVPRVRFLGRRGLVSDLAGEKLDGRHAEAAGAEALAAAGVAARFALLAPEDERRPPSYVLFVEPEEEVPDDRLDAAAGALEDRLRASFHYRYARDLGQLGPVRAFRVTGNGREAFLSARHAAGGRAGDVKLDLLAREPGWTRRLPGRPVPAAASRTGPGGPPDRSGPTALSDRAPFPTIL